MKFTGTSTDLSLEYSHNPFSLIDTSPLEGFDVRPYPTPGAPELTAVIAEHTGLTPSEVLVGNGSDEVLLLLALGLARRGAVGVVPEISFTGYRYALDAAGMSVRTFRTDRMTGLDLDSALQAVDGALVCFLPNPHNPLGSICPPKSLRSFLDETAGRGCTVVIDEAYIDFVPPAKRESILAIVRDYIHVAVIRSLSKSHGLAGVRCGYVAAAPETIQRLAHVKRALPFSVNSVAQAIVPGVLADHTGLVRSATEVRHSITLLSDRLRERGLDVLDSFAAFVTVDVRPANSGKVAIELTQSGIRVRDTTDMGLPGHIRVGACDPSQVERVVDAVIAARTTHIERMTRGS